MTAQQTADCALIADRERRDALRRGDSVAAEVHAGEVSRLLATLRT